MTRTRLISTIFWAALALALFPSPSPAQPCDLPPAVVEAATLSGDQEKQIRDCVATNIRLLESDDVNDTKKGRDGLLKPVQNPLSSVAFRLAYSAAAAPELERVAEDPSEPKAIRALIVAGALGTTQAANVLDRFRQDARLGVRFSAVASYRRLFLAIHGASPAMAPGDALRVVDGLAQQLSAEQDPDVFDACIRSLIAAGELNRAGFEDVRLAGVEALAREAGKRAKALPINAGADPFLPHLVRAGGALRDAAANLQLSLPQGTSRLIVEFGADLWAHVVKRLEAGDLPVIEPGNNAAARQAARALPAQVVQVGQATMFFGAARLGDNQAFEQVKPAPEWVRQAAPEGDEKFTRRARELIGPGGILTKPPFNFPNNRFLDK